MSFSKGIALTFVFFVGALISSVSGLWHPQVKVRVKNVDSRSVEQLEVGFQNTEGKGVFRPYMDRPLKTGEQLVFHFYVESEGAFSMKAVYSDLSVAQGVPGYVELGDVVGVEIIDGDIKVAKKSR